jgi:MFS family permease
MDKSLVRRLNIHGMLLQGTFFFGICTYLVFMVTTLIDYGWSASAAAAAMTVMSVITMLAQPVSGYISDKFLSEKKMSVILITLAAIFFMLLPLSLQSGNVLLVWANMIAITVTAMQVVSLLDAWIVGLNQEFEGINYGLIRGTGSLAFALAAQIAGMMTFSFGHHARFYLGGGFLGLAAIVALALRPTRRANQIDEKSDTVQHLSGKEAFKLVFSSKQYCLLMAVAFFLLLSSAPLGTLLQLLIIDFGGTTAQIGTASAVMAASEVPIMFLMVFILNKLGYKKLFLISSAVYAFRMFVMAFLGSINALISIQVLQAFSFAIIIPLSMSYLSRILDERIRTTAITTYSAIAMSLSGIVGNLITTTLLEMGFTPQHVLIGFALSSLIGFALVLYGVVRNVWDIDNTNKEVT